VDKKYLVSSEYYGKKILKLGEIHDFLSNDCEIFDVTKEQIYLGSLSRLKLIYLGIEILEYALNTYSMIPREEGLKDIFKVTNLSRMWINNPDDNTEIFHKLELFSKNIPQISTFFVRNNYELCAIRVLLDGILRNSNYPYIPDVLEYCNDLSLQTKVDYNIGFESEFQRQGRFVLDFLKSEKSLFMR
jgi:hypothetical protein